jgi:hypothetical protein
MRTEDAEHLLQGLVVADFDAAGPCPQLHSGAPSGTAGQVVEVLYPQRDVRLSRQGLRQHEEGGGTLQATSCQTHGKSWLDLQDDGICLSGEKPNLGRSRNARCGQVAVGSRERVESDDLHFVAFSPQSEHFGEQRLPASGERRRHGTDDEHFHDMFPSDASMASRTRVQL